MLATIYRHDVSLNIVLLSPDKFILDIYEKVLQKYGHKTNALSGPIKALAVVHEQQAYDPVDIVFIDYKQYRNIRWNMFEDELKKINSDIMFANLPTAYIYRIKKLLDNLGR